MSEYPHHHRVLGRVRRVSPTDCIITPTPLDLDRSDNLVQSIDNNTAFCGDLMLGSESDGEESGETAGFTREAVFRQADPTPNTSPRNRIPWEQRRSHAPATAITMMMSPSWQGRPGSPRSGENRGMYLEPSEYGRRLDRQRPSIVGHQWGQLSHGDCDVDHTDDGEVQSSRRAGVIYAGAPSFRFGLPSFERGIPVVPSPPSGYIMDNVPASSEIIPYEEDENSLS